MLRRVFAGKASCCCWAGWRSAFRQRAASRRWTGCSSTCSRACSPNFLLEMGLVAASRFGGETLRRTGPFLIGFAILMPLFGAALGVATMTLGLSVGGVTLLATLYASASYIAAPACGWPMPQANPAVDRRGAGRHLPVQPAGRHSAVPPARAASPSEPTMNDTSATGRRPGRSSARRHSNTLLADLEALGARG